MQHPPKISDLIAKLQQLQAESGDLPVVVTEFEQSFFDSRSIFGLSKMTVADGEIIFAAIVTRQSIESATIEADLLF